MVLKKSSIKINWECQQLAYHSIDTASSFFELIITTNDREATVSDHSVIAAVSGVDLSNDDSMHFLPASMLVTLSEARYFKSTIYIHWNEKRWQWGANMRMMERLRSMMINVVLGGMDKKVYLIKRTIGIIFQLKKFFWNKIR